MRQKVEIEQDKYELLKAARTAIRLKHSLAADREINEKLPELEAEFDKAVAAGRQFELTISDLVYDG